MNHSNSLSEAYAETKSTQGLPLRREVECDGQNTPKTNARAAPKSDDSREYPFLDLGDDLPEWEEDLFAPSVLAGIDLSTPSQRKLSDKSTDYIEKEPTGEKESCVNKPKENNPVTRNIIRLPFPVLLAITLFVILVAVLSSVLEIIAHIETKQSIKAFKMILGAKDMIANKIYLTDC